MKPMSEEHFAILRRHMVEVVAIHAELSSDELGQAALDERVMAAMQRVPRHRFVPEPVMAYAYQDMPLPIGFDKTISQPFIVALMTDLLGPRPHDSVLEIGTGLGYQAAILSELAGQVWSVEVIEEFARQAEATCATSGAPTSPSISATAHAAGLSMRLSTRSSLPPRPCNARRRCLSSSSPAGAWSCPWAQPTASGSPSSTRIPPGFAHFTSTSRSASASSKR
jgi:hypothetical protein